jgi:hypothetical protein
MLARQALLLLESLGQPIKGCSGSENAHGAQGSSEEEEASEITFKANLQKSKDSPAGSLCHVVRGQ